MKVKELAECLAKCDPETDVLILKPNALCEMAARRVGTVCLSHVDAVPTRKGYFGEVLDTLDNEDGDLSACPTVVPIATD